MRQLVLSLMFISTGWLANAEPPKLKVVLLSGSQEYDSDTSLARLKTHLESHYAVSCTLLKAEGTSKLDGLEALGNCDLTLFFTRRLTLDDASIAKIKAYVKSGKPIVAIRTASHGFQNYLEFDKEILGDNYQGHLKNEYSTRAKLTAGAEAHPVLKGVRQLASLGSLYKTSPLASDVIPLLIGTSPEGTEPVAWVREIKGQRIFYTSLGAQSDFENSTFLRLVTNAIFWSVGLQSPEPPSPGPLAARPKQDGMITLDLRSGSTASRREVPASEVAIVVCDMWDRHWCRGATQRCDAIAVKMNDVLNKARKAGVQIVHAPSECMDFYADTPARYRVMTSTRIEPPKVVPPTDIPGLPIDDSDGGCDTDDKVYLAWTRQSPRITIGEFDGISDNGVEIYSFLKGQGIKTVIVMGVHTNMCILNRSFAIKQMTAWGMNCILARDLTDAMYDPKDKPFVAHEAGTNLVIDHIEKYWCPSITSAQLIAGLPAVR